MSSVTKSPYARPTSVMSLLADKMQSSCINEMDLKEVAKSQSIDFKSVSKENFNISSSAPIHRYSIPDTCFNCLNSQNDSAMDHECRFNNESDLSSPQLPSKRLCHSSTYDGIARPIPIKVNIKSHFSNNIQDSSSHFDFNNKQHVISCHKANLSIKTPLRNPCNSTIRPIISPHYKKSAFTPTRYLTSPHTTSSDYSISPDMESPIHRPASLTSSGFHECSQQSLLIDPNCSPDSNQKSNCATIINSTTSETSQSIFPRCHSQPCDEPLSRHYSNLLALKGANKTCPKTSFQPHIPMKRRYPNHVRSTSQSDSTTVQNLDSPTYCQCHKATPNSADTSPSSCGSTFAIPKRDSYFFGNNRSYLISLPRIASSPPPVSLQVDQQNVPQGHRQRIGSNSSSLSTSTTTDANTPTVISNGTLQPKSVADSTNVNVETLGDVEMDDSALDDRSTMIFKSDFQSYDTFEANLDKSLPQMWSDLNYGPSNTLGTFTCTSLGSSCSVSVTSDMTTTKSYSTTSDGTSHCTNISLSINSEESSRDPDDPPEIGFCFSQLNDHPPDNMTYDQHSSFQELDLDQIELD